MTLTAEGPTLSRGEIESRLRALSIEPHDSIIDHLTQLNGARAHDYWVPVGDDDQTGDLVFLGLDFGPGDLEETFEMLQDRIPGGYVPIALDAGGNAFLVAPSGVVRFFDHDRGTTVAAYGSIQALLSALVRDEPAPTTRPNLETMPLADIAELIAQDPMRNGFAACRAGRLDALALLFPDHQEFGNDYLVGAVHSREIPMVEAILDQGVPVNGRDHLGGTALIAAAVKSSLALVEHLLARGADPTLEKNGRTALAFTPSANVKWVLLRAMGEANESS